jgi:hypothetical protein
MTIFGVAVFHTRSVHGDVTFEKVAGGVKVLLNLLAYQLANMDSIFTRRVICVVRVVKELVRTIMWVRRRIMEVLLAQKASGTQVISAMYLCRAPRILQSVSTPGL